MAGSVKRMHTVAQAYLRAFAVKSTASRTPRIWQFGRTEKEVRLVGIRDASVFRDVYTLRKKDGTADTVIEKDLLGELVEAPFPIAVQVLSSGLTPGYSQWRDIFRFVAFQLVRTSR